MRDLLERPPAVREQGWEESALHVFAGDSVVAWLPVLDSDSRPVAVAGRPLVPHTEPRLGAVDRIGTDLSIADAGRRSVRRPVAERLVPFVRCDSRGRYVGLVRVERIVEELALSYDRGHRDPGSRRTPQPLL